MCYTRNWGLTQTMWSLPHASLPKASMSALMSHISSLCYLIEALLVCFHSSRGPLPSVWSRCEWPWDKTFQTWSYSNKLLYPKKFLLLWLMPVPAVHISDRNYVGLLIPSCPATTWTLSFFTSCGAKITLISYVGKMADAERCENGKCHLLW